VNEHAADCRGTDHKNARSHFVCRAFDGHSFQPRVEVSDAECGTFVTSRSGRKIHMSRAARAVLRRKGCDESDASPIVIRSDRQQQDKDEGNGSTDSVLLLPQVNFNVTSRFIWRITAKPLMC